MKKIIKGKKERLRTEFNKLLEEIEDNDLYMITITKQRSLSHNNYFHRACRIIGDEMGEADIEEVKKLLKYQFGLYETDEESGKFMFKSTSDLTPEEFTDFMDKIAIFAYETWNIDLVNLVINKIK